MRLGIVIVLLAAIAVGCVHLRRMQVGARHELQRLHVEQITIRRRLWDQDVRLARETAPDRVRRRARQMPLGLIEKVDLPETLTTGRRPAGWHCE